jgi:selenide,water dikinase
MTDLVLLGAGHAHVEVLRRFALRPDPGVRLTLITREPRTPYSGRLPALIRGGVAPEAAHIDLGPLAAIADARLVVAEATALDLAARQVVVSGRPAIRFDLLSIDIGAMPAIPPGGAPGGVGIGVKPIGGLLAMLAQLESALAEGARIALVGGGAAGTELALALAQRFGGRVRITLVCDARDPLPEAPPRARAIARAALTEARVELVCGVRAGAQAAGRLALSDGSFLAVDAVLWATNVVGPPLLAESGLACDDAGCVLVDATLRSRGHDFVFAAGDCAAIEGQKRPKAGVWAVRAGPRLAVNLRRAAQGQRLRPWRPQAEALVIVGLGHGSAVGWRNGVALAGGLVAWVKDWLDGRFLRRYAPEGLPHRGALAEPAQVGLDAADLAVLAGPAAHPAGSALLQQATQLPLLLNDPFAFGRVAAAQALLGLYAAGARPLTAVVFVTPQAGSPDQVRADVMTLLQGAASVLAADGATLADCMVAPGGAAALALALTGQRDSATAAVGLSPGDALILTKPLGSGIILEGYRRGLAKADWLCGALAVMTASSAEAARILRAHAASGCAVVAEHGLIGTLTGLLRDANLAAVLAPEAIAALPGARELARLGVERGAADANRHAWPDPPDWPDLPLAADPQIAGGLLAGVPAAHADACLAALLAAGYAASCIGRTEARRLDAPRLRLEALALPLASGELEAR